MRLGGTSPSPADTANQDCAVTAGEGDIARSGSSKGYTVTGPRNQAVADQAAGDADDVKPFDESDDAATPEDAKHLAMVLADGVADGAVARVLTPDDSGAALQIKPEALANTPFAITDVRVSPIVGNYDTGEIAHYLAVVTAQAVKLDANNTITKKGRVVVFVAGRCWPDDPDDTDRNSVLGREMMNVSALLSPTPQRPIIVPTGLRVVGTAAGGQYYTTRPEPSKAVDLFPD